MTITLYNNTSDNIRLSKTLTQITQLTGTLRANCDVLNPVILFEGEFNVNCNYLHIPDFGRYYYVTDITVINSNMYQVTAHVDVLQTYAAQIKTCTGIIARQENSYNRYLNDSNFKIYQNPIIKTTTFPQGFDTHQLILAVAGG